MGNKLYVDAQSMLLDSYRLGKKIFTSGFRPDFLIGIWRGGTPVGIAVQEYLLFKGINPYHTAIRTQSYTDIGQQGGIAVSGLEHVLTTINSRAEPSRILLVDDVFDTGRTMKKVLAIIKAASILEPDIAIATLYYKPSKNQTDIEPDFYLHESDEWIVFPHELEGLSEEELREKGEEIYKIIADEPSGL